MGLAEWEEEGRECLQDRRTKVLYRFFGILQCPRDSGWFCGMLEILSGFSDAVLCGACDCTKKNSFLSFFFPFSLGDGPFCVEVIIIIITNDLISANNWKSYFHLLVKDNKEIINKDSFLQLKFTIQFLYFLLIANYISKKNSVWFIVRNFPKDSSFATIILTSANVYMWWIYTHLLIDWVTLI